MGGSCTYIYTESGILLHRKQITCFYQMLLRDYCIYRKLQNSLVMKMLDFEAMIQQKRKG